MKYVGGVGGELVKLVIEVAMLLFELLNTRNKVKLSCNGKEISDVLKIRKCRGAYDGCQS